MNSMVDITDREKQIAGRIDNAITNSLAVSERGAGIQFVNAGQVTEFAKIMACANIGVRKHLRGNPGACLAVCVQAIEWGMSPYAVANKSYLVNDQIAYESQLVQAVILMRAPIKGRIKFEFTGAGPTLQCRAWARLRDEEDEIVEYISPTFDKIAVKNSPLWKADPEQQFSYYSGRALCRRHFPDVLLGVYTPEEFIDGAPAPDVALAPAPRTMNARFDAIASGGQTQSVPQAEHVVDHDEDGDEDHKQPDEGDEAEGGNAGQPDGAGAGSGQPASATDEAQEGVEDSRRNVLMNRLRAKAEKGLKPLRLALGGLIPADNEVLSQQDRKYLEGLAEDAERERAEA